VKSLKHIAGRNKNLVIAASRSEEMTNLPLQLCSKSH